jgi:glycosyltransferase involved in cell wall biosynthesis
MSLLTIIIPTRNRADYLKENLSLLSPILDKYEGINILVCNNASTDHTEEVLDEWKSRYQCIQSVLQPEFCSYDVNVATGYRTANSDYLWVLGDSYEIPIETFELVYNQLQKKDVSALILNTFNRIDKADCQYHSAADVMYDMGWYLTYLCSCIISSEFIKHTELDRFMDTYFIHYGVFFDYFSRHPESNVLWLSKAHLKAIRIQGISRDKNMRSWRETPFDVFGKGWFGFIMSLPYNITLENKRKCIIDHDKNQHIFSFKTLLAARLKGIADFSDYKSSRSYMKWVTTTPLWIIDIISILPPLPKSWRKLLKKN